MSFLYINPGYSSITDGPHNGNSFADIGTNSTSSDNNIYNSKSFAFIRSSNDSSISLNNEKEYWIKYGKTTLSNTNAYNYLTIVDSTGNNTINIYSGSVLLNNTTSIATFTWQKTYTDIEFHVKSDSTTGIIEMWENSDTLIFSYTGNVLAGNNISYINLNIQNSFNYSDTYLSNIIIKDTGRIGSEKVAILSASAIDTDMTTSNDNYSSSIAGAHYYMLPDKASFITNKSISADLLKITGVSVGIITAQYDSGNLNLVDLYIKNKSTGVETLLSEHQCVQSTSKKGIHSSGMIDNPITNSPWELSDLDNIEFGMKTKSST